MLNSQTCPCSKPRTIHPPVFGLPTRHSTSLPLLELGEALAQPCHQDWQRERMPGEVCQSQTRLGILPSPMSSPLPLVQFHSDFLKYFTPYFNIFRGMDLKLKHCQYWLPDWAVDKEMLTWCQHFCAHLLPKSESCILFAFFWINFYGHTLYLR